MRELVEELTTASRQQAILRSVMLGATLVFAVAVVLAGESSVWALAILSGLGGAAAVNPHTGLPAFVMLYLVVVWAVGVQALWTPWSLVAALCLLAFHTSAAVAASVPSAAPLSAELWRRYAVRLGWVTAATTVVWLLALLVEAVAVPGAVVGGIAAMVLLGVGLAVHYLTVTRQSETGGR